MEWIISERGEKRAHLVYTPLLIINFQIILLIIFICFLNFSLKDILIFSIVMISVDCLIFAVAFFMSKTLDVPRVIKIDGDIVSQVKMFSDSPIEDVKFNLKDVYKIEIKSEKKVRIYYRKNGREFFWSMMGFGYIIREDKEKLMNVLREILNRVDKNRVEVVDKRKKKRV